MSNKCHANEVVVSLPITFVEAILSVRSSFDQGVASALAKSLVDARTLNEQHLPQPVPSVAVPDRGKYAAEFLGVRFAAATLADVFCTVVDMMAEVAPEALVSLSEIRTPGRRFVAKDPHQIHPHSPHLPVLRSVSGWWLSKNISQGQLKLALRKTCEVSRLTFGKDIKFPLR
ncbi:hypothetical protein [Phaeovulum vinaykumarii]|uniref:Uncharacterized protein n=1 Tax=Phaeovulum vinaykumarii TaxID=407234 RepID=A0A1N7N163_9RHOB|nr:hypothetical protein [Phaeovulum vinaykumarii]SIS92143.1 hypothetical protein SAMN05421795_11338 [Phaeovulum vinaykumarii]SOC17958.1 hypothetical protein SAMN05878426_11338 [Phaeovulum vinaykumarii]